MKISIKSFVFSVIALFVGIGIGKMASNIVNSNEKMIRGDTQTIKVYSEEKKIKETLRADYDFVEETEQVIVEETTYQNQDNKYIIPFSSSRIITVQDVDDLGLTLQEINYAKNEIYARYGRKFKSNELMEYFNQQSWYHGSIDPENFNDSWLSDIEIKNAIFLTKLEEERGSYKLDR